MSGETIKDVVIRVAIKPGDMSEFSSAMKQVCQDIQSVVAAQKQAWKDSISQASSNLSQMFQQPLQVTVSTPISQIVTQPMQEASASPAVNQVRSDAPEKVEPQQQTRVVSQPEQQPSSSTDASRLPDPSEVSRANSQSASPAVNQVTSEQQPPSVVVIQQQPQPQQGPQFVVQVVVSSPLNPPTSVRPIPPNPPPSIPPNSPPTPPDPNTPARKNVSNSSQSADFEKVIEEIRYWFSSKQKIAVSSIKVGREGYGQHVRERAEEIARHEMAFAKRSGLTDNLSHRETEKLHRKLKRNAVSTIKETDTEHANSVNDFVQNERKRIQALQDSQNAAINAARSFAQLAASTNEDSATMVRNIAQVEGFTNVLKGAGTAMGLAGIGLAVLGAELLLTKVAFDESRDSSRHYWESITGDAVRTQSRLSTVAQREHSQATQTALRRPDITESKRWVENINRRESREKEIREFEAGNYTPERKAQFRQQAEARGHHEEQRSKIEDQIAFKKKQLEELQGANAQLKKDKENVVAAGRNAVRAADKEIEQATFETGYGRTHRKIHTWGHALSGAMGFNTGIDNKTGYFNSQIQAKNEATKRRDNVAQQAKEEEAQAQQKITENQEKQLAIEKDLGVMAVQNLSTTKAKQQAAYEAYRNESQRVTQGRIAFGSSSISQQNMVLRLQRKHKLIEAKREENRKLNIDEDTDLPQYTPFELQQDPMGSIAGISMRRQQKKIAEDRGYEMETDVDEKKKEFEKQEKLPVVAEQKKAVEDQSEKIKAAAKEFEDALKNAFRIDDLLDALKFAAIESGKKLEEDLHKFKMTFNR